MTIAENLDRLVTAKNDIADAITNKGVEVSETDGFEEYPALIDSIQAGGGEDAITKMIGTGWQEFDANYPFQFGYSASYGTSAVILNDTIHILGTANLDTKPHYKWNGTDWIAVSTLPYDFGQGGNAIVFNGEIHIFGGKYGEKNHYKWNGSNWVSVSKLPFGFNGANAIVYNGEIHLLGLSSTTEYNKHYKWNGSTWVHVSTIPYSCYSANTVVFNGEIHTLGGSSYNARLHYKWDGTDWTSVSTLPYNFYKGGAVVYNNELHILGAIDASYTGRWHYKWNGSSWINCLSIPVSAGFPTLVTSRIIVMNGFTDQNYTLSNKYYIYYEKN